MPDLMDVMDNMLPRAKCSAFIKRMPGEIYLAHNSWFSFLDQSMAATFAINDTLVTVNAITPGNILSNTDFGYNKNGISFNETTLLSTYTEPKVDALWMFLRGTLAEQFASSIDEFFRLILLEASGTYMNGFRLVEANTQEIGLVEMSFRNSVFFKSDGRGPYEIRTKPEGLSTEYDTQLLGPDVIIGVNFPASLLIRDEIKSIENRPMRRQQFLERMDTVTDVASAKALITYTAPGEPLSIYGRWDLRFGTTPTPKMIPEGSLDAKVTTATQIRAFSDTQRELSPGSPRGLFRMKYGTPVYDGKPFFWTESCWSGQTLRDIPDRVDGEWVEVRATIR